MRLHDFQLAPWVTDYALYYDLIHYTSDVNDAMAEAMRAETYLVSDSAQIDDAIQALRRAVYALFDSSEERNPS